MEYKYIAVYGKIHNRSANDNETLANILRKARELYNRLVGSYADDNIRILLFAIDKDLASQYLPRDKIEVYDCKNIQDMSNRILEIVKDNEFESRVYIVLVNWQWRYIEPLLRLKHSNLKFFYEGALDARSVDEIKREKEYEKSAIVKIKRGGLLGLLDLAGSNISTDLKG